MTVVLQSTELSKWFGEVVALNNLDVSIGTGVTGLLGPNGAGKSTFIKLALGIYTPSRGRIEVLGGPPHNNRHVLSRIGYCPETDTFFENMTGYEFVYWLNRHWGMYPREARRAAEDAIEQVHMTGRMHDPIDEYSMGMRQRIKVAQALAIRPELLFLDEPMSGLDPQGREEMYALVRRLGAQGLSVIVSSHILYEIERVTDNVVLLYRGSMLAHGRVRQIRELIDEHPHTITVECANPRLVAGRFLEESDAMSVSFDDDNLTLRTRDPNACYALLNTIAEEEPGQIRAILCADDNLQAVFDYLTK